MLRLYGSSESRRQTPAQEVRVLGGAVTLVKGLLGPAGNSAAGSKAGPVLLKFESTLDHWHRTFQGVDDADTQNWAARLRCAGQPAGSFGAGYRRTKEKDGGCELQQEQEGAAGGGGGAAVLEGWGG